MLCSSASELIVAGYCVQESFHELKKHLDTFLDGKESTKGY